MELKYYLIILYLVFGIINTYCFLFQRTARKIRQYSVGTELIGLEKKLLPDWYHWLFMISFLRLIPLVWLFIINWKVALVLFVIMGILKLILPVNDYSNIQKIKKHLENKIASFSELNLNNKLYEIVLEAEKKTL